MIGLYALHNSTNPVEQPAAVSSFFSTASATVTTVFPNFVLTTPSPTTPPYAFNTSIAAKAGKIVSSGLATSTYSAVLNTRHPNATAIPAVSFSPTLVTFIITSDGQTVTSVSTASTSSVTLGTPPGWKATSGSSAIQRAPTCMIAFLGIALFGFLSCLVDLVGL